MEILSAELKNFVTHKHSEIDFSKNNYNIVSERNGFGKSLIIDAISWCLYGKMLRGGRGDDVIGKFKSSCSVETIWSYHGKDFKYISITRYRKHKIWHNRVDIRFSKDFKTWTGIDRSKETVRDTDKYIIQLFKMDYDLFVSGISLSKSKPELNFFESKDTRRKDILTGLLNLDWIDRAKKKAVKEQSRLKDKIGKFDSELEKKEHQLSNIEKIIKTFRNHDKNFLNKKKSKISSIKEKINDTSGISTVSINGLLRKKKKILSKIKKIDIFKNKLQKVYEEENINNKKLLKYRKIDNILDNKIDTLNSKIKNISDKHDTICDNCGSKVLEKNVSKLRLSWKKDIKILELQKKDNSRKLNILGKKESNISKQIFDLESNIETYNRYYVDLEKNKKYIERFKKEKEDKEKLLEQLKLELEECRKEKNPWVSEINTYIKKKKTVKSEIESVNSKIKIYSKKINLCNYAVEAFGNSGIKNDIISSKIQLLEEKINYYLSKISSSGDIRVRLDNKVQRGSSERIGIMITDSEKLKPLDYSMWSGGQRTTIRLAGEYALNAIMEIPINLLVIDEGFDFIDSISLNKITELIKLEKKKVLFISNRPEMKGLFPNTITVMKEGGCSTIKQS